MKIWNVQRMISDQGWLVVEIFYKEIMMMMIPTILWDSQAELSVLVTRFHPGGGAVSPSSSTTDTSQTSNRNFSTLIVIF